MLSPNTSILLRFQWGHSGANGLFHVGGCSLWGCLLVGKAIAVFLSTGHAVWCRGAVAPWGARRTQRCDGQVSPARLCSDGGACGRFVGCGAGFDLAAGGGAHGWAGVGDVGVFAVVAFDD